MYVLVEFNFSKKQLKFKTYKKKAMYIINRGMVVPNPVTVVNLGVLKESTLTFLANYTKSLSDAQKFAVQALLDGMSSNGIDAYVNNLYLPILANQLSEAMYNKQTGVNDQASINATYWELNADGGIKAKNDSVTVSGADRLLIPFGGNGESTQGFHFLLGHMNTIADLATEAILFGDDDTANPGKFFGTMKISLGQEAIEVKNTSTGNPYLSWNGSGYSLTKTRCVQGIMSDQISKKFIHADGGVYNAYTSGAATPNPEGDVSLVSRDLPFLTSYSDSTGANRISAGVVSMGLNMPDALVGTYQQLLQTFLDNF